MEKVKLPVNKGICLVLELIKEVSLCREMEVSTSWMYKRRNKSIIRNYRFDFSKEDVRLLNETIWRMAKRIESVEIVYNTDRQCMIEQIRQLLSEIKMPYIYQIRMKKQDWWWKARMMNSDASGAKRIFSEEDIWQINLAAKEIAARLLNIELIPECD